MFSTVAAKMAEIRAWVVERVKWAEINLKGKTGAEKRKAVVDRLDDLIKLPFWLEWADGYLIGVLVDNVCNLLNILTDDDKGGHDWTALEASPEEVAALMEIPAEQIKTSVKAHSDQSVDERFAALCAEYGISTNDGNLTKNFSRSEFACKCGCGFDDVAPELAEMCQTIRDALNQPVRINSGCRCTAHNAKVGGVANSTHTQGKAADLSCAAGADRLFETVKSLHESGRLPALSYCLKYPSFVHIDCGEKKRSKIFAVKE